MLGWGNGLAEGNTKCEVDSRARQDRANKSEEIEAGRTHGGQTHCGVQHGILGTDVVPDAHALSTITRLSMRLGMRRGPDGRAREEMDKFLRDIEQGTYSSALLYCVRSALG